MPPNWYFKFYFKLLKTSNSPYCSSDFFQWRLSLFILQILLSFSTFEPSPMHYLFFIISELQPSRLFDDVENEFAKSDFFFSWLVITVCVRQLAGKEYLEQISNLKSARIDWEKNLTYSAFFWYKNVKNTYIITLM